MEIDRYFKASLTFALKLLSEDIEITLFRERFSLLPDNFPQVFPQACGKFLGT